MSLIILRVAVYSIRITTCNCCCCIRSHWYHSVG